MRIPNFAAFSVVILAAGAGVAGVYSYSQSTQSGATLASAKALLERELPLAGDFSVVKKPPSGNAAEDRFVISKTSLENCQLSILRTEQPFYNNPNLRSLVLSHVETATLKDVDVSRIRTGEFGVSAGYTQSRPYFYIQLIAVGDGKPFSTEYQQTGRPKTVTAQNSLLVPLADKASATRIAETLRQASVLCGAPDKPAATPVAEPAQVPSSSTGMTNNDVVKLVAAGLSDQVIETSIRQAATKSFDVTPAGLVALKKAGVSDAVIVVMLAPPQSPAAPSSDAKSAPSEAPAASSNAAKPAPKYDPDLAKPTPRATPTQPSNGCEAIEAMGLFKNNTGVAGLVEWLAKIRNNGGVTRIVTYGWMDQYGQQRNGQAQIQGGQISSIRLDLTQDMFIPPVSNLRLISCQ